VEYIDREEELMSNVIWQTILSICGITLIISAILLFIVAVYPFDVLSVDTPLRVLTPIVEQGDCVFVLMKYNQKVDGPATITAQVITEQESIIASQQLSLKLQTGEHETVIGFTLPRNITTPKGETTLRSKLEITSRYEIFGFRNLDITYCTEKFLIIPRKN
jgi:hypothetical protein